MGFTNWARVQSKLDILADGRTGNSRRQLGIMFVASRKTPFLFGYVAGAPDPTEMNLSGSQIAFNGGDLRSTVDVNQTSIGSSTPVRANFFTGTGRILLWVDGSAFPSQKNVKYIFHRPEDIIHVGYITGSSGAGNHVAGQFRIPNFRNLKTISLQNGAVSFVLSAAYTGVTSIVGIWPEKMEGFFFTNKDTSGYLTSIERKFPKTLKHFAFGQADATIIASLPGLIADCTNLISLLFTNENWAEGGIGSTFSTPLTGTLNISQIVANSLQYFSIANASGLTNITYTAGAFASLKRINLYSVSGLNNTTLANIFNEFLSSPNGEFVQIRLNNATFTRAMVDADFKSTLTAFITYGNKITGNITLNTAKPALVEFRCGDTSSSLTDGNKSNYGVVDLRGLTNATVIDASNGLITDLQLPVNTVVTELYLGGNRLSRTTNPNIINQIRAMTALVQLRFSTGAFTGTDGQGTSADGLGSNVDLSTLTLLNTLYITACKLTGTLTLPPAITGLICKNNAGLNALVSSTGSFPNLTIMFLDGCTSLNLDWTPFQKLTIYSASGTATTLMDISGRTATTQIASISTNGSASINTVKLPANAANAILTSNPIVDFRDCPLLTSIQNLENLSYPTLTGGSNRTFNASGCALNIDFKIGINNWLPSQIVINNNGMSQANVDLNIDNIYQNRGKWSTTGVTKSLTMGGTNATPTGTYAAPPGFVLGVSDGTPTTGKQKIYVLVNNYGWTISYTP